MLKSFINGTLIHISLTIIVLLSLKIIECKIINPFLANQKKTVKIKTCNSKWPTTKEKAKRWSFLQINEPLNQSRLEEEVKYWYKLLQELSAVNPSKKKLNKYALINENVTFIAKNTDLQTQLQFCEQLYSREKQHQKNQATKQRFLSNALLKVKRKTSKFKTLKVNNTELQTKFHEGTKLEAKKHALINEIATLKTKIQNFEVLSIIKTNE